MPAGSPEFAADLVYDSVLRFAPATVMRGRGMIRDSPIDQVAGNSNAPATKGR